MEITTLTGVNACTSWPATAQIVRIPSFSVMSDAFPMNWTLGTSDISARYPKWFMIWYTLYYRAASIHNKLHSPNHTIIVYSFPVKYVKTQIYKHAINNSCVYDASSDMVFDDPGPDCNRCVHPHIRFRTLLKS